MNRSRRQDTTVEIVTVDDEPMPQTVSDTEDEQEGS